MRTRTVVIAAVAALVLAAAGGVAAAQNTSDNTTVDNTTADEADADVQLSFGEQISILVANHQTEVSHTVENAAFEVAFERDAEAAVEDRARQLQERVDRAEEKQAEIDEKVESGEMSERRAMAEKAKLSVEAEAVNRSADSVLDKAAEQGINTSAVETLKQNASELSGEEVSRIARSIAGPGVAEDRRPRQSGVTENQGSEEAPDRPEGERSIENDDGGVKKIDNTDDDEEEETAPSNTPSAP